jgi:hypothetical protein
MPCGTLKFRKEEKIWISHSLSNKFSVILGEKLTSTGIGGIRYTVEPFLFYMKGSGLTILQNMVDVN